MKKRIDLEFWLDVYDRIEVEEDALLEESNYIYEFIGRPYTDKVNKELKEIDDLYHKYREMELYVRERILKYNR